MAAQTSLIQKLAVWAFLMTGTDDAIEPLVSEVIRETRETYPTIDLSHLSSSTDVGPVQFESILFACRRAISKWKRKGGGTLPLPSSPASSQKLELPPGLNLAPWWKVKSRLPSENLEAFILSFVFGETDDRISRATAVSAGTVRYRRANVLSTLGEFLQQSRMGKNS